jgi:hypothetical protein
MSGLGGRQVGRRVGGALSLPYLPLYRRGADAYKPPSFSTVLKRQRKTPPRPGSLSDPGGHATPPRTYRTAPRPFTPVTGW